MNKLKSGNGKPTTYSLQDFKVVRRIGEGSFGEIFQAKLHSNGQHVAVKVERKHTQHPQLSFEHKLYVALQGRPGIPKVYDFFNQKQYNLLVMELLGSSLDDLLNYCGGRFSIKTVLMLADQMIKRLQMLHENNFIHRDVKPQNFLMGLGEKSNEVYIIDFGLAKKYRNALGTHILYGEGKSLTGTARYVSINTHLGIEQSRRDDMEALSYMLMYFLSGHLPWQGLVSNSKKQKFELITEKKLSTSLDDLCSGFPPEFAIFIQDCRSLKFTETPKYLRARRFFHDLYAKLQYCNDSVFDWNTLELLQKQRTQMLNSEVKPSLNDEKDERDDADMDEVKVNET
ncbi:casein kinase I [Scaptodrosophila lebanonensis]|uniref:non-specific serine/threonine protein kinase n=1 Tax=Drosophila lebanonensis TaxID=7225 RepID=A0A6J2U6X7_DROLE|nr:casein kinase I [Scaptodrosophila lebanonensis]